MSLPQASDMTAVMLMKGEDADSILESVQELQPGVTVTDAGTYWLIEKPGEIYLDVEDIASRAGRPMNVHELMVSFASYVGRPDVGEGYIRVTSEMLQLESE